MRANKIEYQCQTCGKTVRVSMSAAARGGKYCSKPCKGKAMIGQKGPGRPFTGNSRKRIGDKLEHRVRAEQALGKELPSSCPIHHPFGVDGPIVICESQEYHSLLHIRQRAYEATGNARKRKCRYCQQWDDPENMAKRPSRGDGFYHRACDSADHLARYYKRKDYDNDCGKDSRKPIEAN